MASEFISREKFSSVEAFAVAGPQSWTRLEPQSSSGDPRPGIEARVHDPLWLLARQWQLGEFQGEDAGTPLTVRVVTRTTAMDRLALGDNGQVSPFGRGRPELLEPIVEREPARRSGPGLRARAEAASALLAALDDAGLGQHRATFADNCPLELDSSHFPDGANATLDPQWQRLVRLLGGRGMADGELICQELEAAATGLPPWLVPADRAEEVALRGVLEPWVHWYRSTLSPAPGGEDAWVGERLEYRFRTGAGPAALVSPAHDGGDIDWYTFDALPDGSLPEPADAPPAPDETREVHALLATPLRYAGMPADRLWEMEDAQVNLGVVEAEPWDLARLLVAEFALTYGNDWLVVPIDLPLGSLTTVESLVYTTTFGESFVVEPTAAASPDGHWRMFTLAGPPGATGNRLLLPTGAVAVQDGPAIEEVLFLRDEMANLAWAVERKVQGPSGAGRDRSRESDPPAFGQGPMPQAQLDYLLQTGLPARWIPYLPRSSGYRAIELVRGAMPDADGTPIAPLGRLLRDKATKVLKDAEVPREGIIVRRQPSMTRRADGGYEVWTTRRVGVGRGEGASQLAFDSAIPRRPRPNG